jgi:hypothetical protein
MTRCMHHAHCAHSESDVAQRELEALLNMQVGACRAIVRERVLVQLPIDRGGAQRTRTCCVHDSCATMSVTHTPVQLQWLKLPAPR